jgi:hypothetical protein
MQSASTGLESIFLELSGARESQPSAPPPAPPIHAPAPPAGGALS